MIFKPELVARILAGEKTQTRRPVKTLPTILSEPNRVPCRYEVGKTYAIQPGRGKKAVGRLKVTGVRRERWIDISEADALAEGFSHPPAPTTRRVEEKFLDYVDGLYEGFDPYAECWVIEFELVSTVRLPGDDGTGG